MKQFLILLTTFILALALASCGFDPYAEIESGSESSGGAVQDNVESDLRETEIEIQGGGHGGGADQNDELESTPVEDTPPTLKLEYCGKQYTAFMGAYLWYYSDGYGDGVTSSEASPILLQQAKLPCFTAVDSAPTVTLIWTKNAPDKVTVKRWGEESWGQYFAQPTVIYESALGGSAEIPVITGTYIYEIVAEWTKNGNESTACYGFFTLAEE